MGAHGISFIGSDLGGEKKDGLSDFIGFNGDLMGRSADFMLFNSSTIGFFKIDSPIQLAR